MEPRIIALVIDPVQSVKGKVVIDAFKLIDPAQAMMEEEFNQTTSNVGHLKKPSPVALYNGLNKHYFSLVISYNKNENDQNMLLNLYKKKWSEDLKNTKPTDCHKSNSNNMQVSSSGLKKTF